MNTKQSAPYPDHMVRKFLEDPARWEGRIRDAAVQRGIAVEPGTPLSAIVLTLHGLIQEKAARR